MNLISLGCLLLLMELLCYVNGEKEEDPDYIFSGDAVFFHINETTFACSKTECNFVNRRLTENFYTHARKVFHIYAKGRTTTNDPIRYGDEVVLFHRMNDEGYGLWLGCASGSRRCGLGTCPGFPHLNHWMWMGKHSCDENKFVIAGSTGLQNGTTSRQPVRIEHEIKLTTKSVSAWITGGKRNTEGNLPLLSETPLFQDLGKWVIKKDMIAKCGNKHYDVRYKACDKCGTESYIRPKLEAWKCCAETKPYNTETSLCCEGSVSVLDRTHRGAKEARCCSNTAFFPDKQVCCQGKVRDLPGQDTDADDTIVQCCGSEPYLSTHGVCCNDVLTPFYTLKTDSKDALNCCGDQGFNNRTSFCYSCGKTSLVLPVSEKKSWSCCKEEEIYKSEEAKCCEYGVEKGTQCKCQFQNRTYMSGQRFSEEPATTSCRSCFCNDGESVCENPPSCPPKLPGTCMFYPDNEECCPVFQCFNSEIQNYKLFVRRKSHVSIKTSIPELTAMTISFWMRTQQDSEGTVLSYATQRQPDELVIRTHPSLRVILKGSPQGDETDWDLNDGNWHFLWIEWESSGHLIIREGTRTIGPVTSTQTSLDGNGYLVLGQRQQSQKQFIEAKAFVGEISHVNIWSEKRTDFAVLQKDCVGLPTGDIFHLQDNTIDSHQSASILATDICPEKALHFPNKAVDDFVMVSGMPRLTAFTVCLWMNSKNSPGSLVSYNVSTQGRELVIDYNGQFKLTIDNTNRETSVSPNNGVWHHICVSWESSLGSWRIYKDGHLEEDGNGFKTGHQIRQGGSLVLGQEQGSVGGGFDSTKSFQGMLQNANIWDHVLSTATIDEMSRFCLLNEWGAGNVFKWRDFLREAQIETTLVKPSTCEPLGVDNAFHFPNKGVTDFVGVSGTTQELTAFTVCFWMNSNNTQGTPFSYATRDEIDELVIDYNGHFRLTINSEVRTTSVAAFNSQWHHICATWESSLGSWKFYKDGEMKDEDTNLQKDHKIRPSGSLVLGQEQDSVGGDFNEEESFQGMLSNVNVWDHVLDSTQIEVMSASCLLHELNDPKIYGWIDFLREGGATIVKPSPCKPVEIYSALHFPDKGVTDFVMMSGMESLTAFTVCLWMNSSSIRGTPLSYAVDDQFNELVIEYNRNFRLLIDGEIGQTSFTAYDGMWHHICVSWENSLGSWKFYKDGGLEKEETNLKKDHTIRAGGSLMLGQEQDSLGGSFESDQSYQGMLSNLNIWDKVLTATQIQQMSQSCMLPDNITDHRVYKWIDFLREGNARLVQRSTCALMEKDYAFHFPNKGVDDYVLISGMPRDLAEFTVCLWMKSSNNEGSLLSYARDGQPNNNELLIKCIRNFRFLIRGTKQETTVTANDGVWHHICLLWENNSGSWKFYKDCDLKDQGTGFKQGFEIRQGGSIVLGQDQDCVGGCFREQESFQGMLSNVNVWDRVIPATQIKEMSQSCLSDEWNDGNLYKWIDFLRQGGVKLVGPSPCEPFGIFDYAFHFPEQGVTDVVQISGMRSLTAFTVCFWMSSSNTQGTPFSYAVSSSNYYNELLIEYDGSFKLVIDNTRKETSVTAFDGLWHHICVSWESTSGAWKFYKDGYLEKEGRSLKTGHEIRRNGILVLGQDQDELGSGFREDQSFQGMLSNVNVWSTVLPGTQIKEMSKTCHLDEWNDGNVFRWSDFLSQGGVMLVRPSPCKPVKKDCQDGLGMVSGAIFDEQISASSEWNDYHAASQGRLYLQESGRKQGAWSAGGEDVSNPWLQVDLGNMHTRVTVVATQGRNSETHNQWVKKYKLQYSNDGQNFVYYRERGQSSDKELPGNVDKDTVVSHVLTPQIMARYFRFRPRTWQERVSMRVELYGCPEHLHCHGPLGMENRLISDNKITASSQYDGNHAASRARLYLKTSGGRKGAWSAGTNNAQQWLQIDLGSQNTRVTGIATQGRNSNTRSQWVTAYKLQYSNDGTSFQYYRQQGQTIVKEFDGNEDQDTPVYHALVPPITARYIRFQPLTWHGHISMRTELYGCPASATQLFDNAVSKSRSIIPTQTPESGGQWIFWNGHYYSHREKSAAYSWYTAEGVCREHGDTVHLASIHNQQENDFIRSLSSDEQWIGITDDSTRSNSFRWIDRSHDGDFTHWADGEPNHSTIDEDCGAMKPDGTWMDVACIKQRLTGVTRFDRRAFTCKTSGNTVNYGTTPSAQERINEPHQPSMSIADLTSAGQSIKVIFFTGLNHIAPNGKFTSTADKVQYGARLKFGGYVKMTSEQLAPLNFKRRRDATHVRSVPVTDPDNDLSGVADLDGVVDKIEIPHYSTISATFSIEFWIRPRTMPIDSTPVALFLKSSDTSGSISLNLNQNGALTFSATPRTGSPSICTTDITDDTNKVRILEFFHIAVTGRVGRSLMIAVNGESACQTTAWEGMTVLPASNEGPLVFGENALDSRQLKRFDGQISNIQLFNTERTEDDIEESIRESNPTAADSIGFWSLRQSDEIKVLHYVISNSQSVSNLKVLEEYDPPLTGYPVEVVVQNQHIYIIRITEENHVVAKKFALSADKRTILSASGSQRVIESSQAEKSCLAVSQDQGRNRLILVECLTEDQVPGAMRFKWNIFEIDAQGQITPTTQDSGRGSLLVTGIGSLDTRLSAHIVNNHLLLTAGTTSDASTFFLDITLDASGFPSISVNEMAVEHVGPEVADSGATYYAYLQKENGATSKPFLRRIRPENGAVSSSYIIDIIDTNTDTLVANAISDNMLDNDWFWFLFKISTFNGGIAIQSGDRINIQTPDNNPRNDRGWSLVKGNCESLQADQEGELLLNFWIFKTESCDMNSASGYSVVYGEIGPNDCILLWPKTDQFEPGYYQSILAHPTEKEIQSARVRFGSWFGPWRLMSPTETSPLPLPVTLSPPLPLPANSPPNNPRNVKEGNKYSLLHFGEGILVEPPSAQSGVRGGLLQFAKSTLTPTIVSNSQSPTFVKLIFRGNGGHLPLAAFPHDEKAKLEVLFSTVYKEGSYAQQRMSSGLFYSIAYTLPSDFSSPGEFKNLARIGGLGSLEYPNPPASFVWVIPPPFKISGMSAAISTVFQFSDNAVSNVAPNSVTSLTEVVNKALGPGSFGEGLFKPFVSVHFDVDLLQKIGERVHASLIRKIHAHLPKPPPARPTNRPASGSHSWQELGDLQACVILSNLTFWNNKVQQQRIRDRLTQVLQSKWMTEQIYQIRQEVASDLLIDIDSYKYSAYGGIAVLLATRLSSPEFLEELLTHDQSYIQPILDSHLRVLDLIRPDLGMDVRQDIMSTLLAKEIHKQPWTIVHSQDEEKQRHAISMAISTIYEGNVPDEVRADADESFTILSAIFLYPLTSTQLGVYTNFLDLRKLQVLGALNPRVRDFMTKYKNILVKKENRDMISQVDSAIKGKDHLDRFLDNYRWQRLTEDEHFKNFLNLPNMKDNIEKLRIELKEELNRAGSNPLVKPPRGAINKILLKYPGFVKGLTRTLNVLGTMAAVISIYMQVTSSNSGLWQDKIKHVMSVLATVIGAAGSVRGTYDIAKVLKQELFRSETTFFNGIRRTPVVPARVSSVAQMLAAEHNVDLNNVERMARRLARMLKTQALATQLSALGVVADLIFLGISISDLCKDFAADNVDPWKIADDFGLATSAGLGAALGIFTFNMLGTLGTAEVVAPETLGIGALLTLAIGFAASISDAMRQEDRNQQESEREWRERCCWSRDLLNHYRFLEDSDADYCGQCPNKKKHHILRALCSNQRSYPRSFKRTLINGRNSEKDVKSFVPSLKKTEKKTAACPAWLRHVFKGQGKRH